jgi:hypothetical protein
MEGMGNLALAPEERYTYRHYKTWPDSERWELIEIAAYLRGKPCQAYIAPFDLLLPAGDEADDDSAARGKRARQSIPRGTGSVAT